ncbi:hypothetical protein L6452_11223 [Arctium lappa]|uniref:Uncharacterized protein n=1 Tax=Arctium lappa TaxID=4217 RepID=A0ACB9DNJ2_ARCLA|nr:hypothetical protein L6452_11223 [Arctium lappa]
MCFSEKKWLKLLRLDKLFLSVPKKQKISEEWALAKKQEFELLKKKKVADRKLIFHRAKQYNKEYEDQVWLFLLLVLSIRGINAMDPKSKKILQLLCLRQVRFAADLPHSVSLLNPLFIPTIVLDPYRSYNVIIS